MQTKIIALLAVVFAVGAGAANAASITRTYQGSASGFADSSQPTLVSPIASLDFLLTVTFDPAATVAGFNSLDSFGSTPSLGATFGPFGFQYSAPTSVMTIGDNCYPPGSSTCIFTVSSDDLIIKLGLANPDSPTITDFVLRVTGTYPTGGSDLGTFRPTNRSVWVQGAAVPEPGTLVLLGLGLAGLGLSRRHKEN